MRLLTTVLIGLAVTAASWAGGPVPVSAEDAHGPCQPGPAFVPGASVGPIGIGTPLDAVQRKLGRPQSAEGRAAQGHQWTRLVYPGLTVLGMDNTVVALNVPQAAPVPVATSCGTTVGQPLYLPVANVRQQFGPPPVVTAAGDLQYFLYNALGLLVTMPAAGPWVQGVTVYGAGQYCTVVPRLVSLGWFTVQAGSMLQCDRETREGPDHS